MVAFERRAAVLNRTNYEEVDGSFARKAIKRLVIIARSCWSWENANLQLVFLIIGMIIKNVIIYHTSPYSNINERLLEAFLFECTPIIAALTNVCAGSTWLIGILVCLFWALIKTNAYICSNSSLCNANISIYGSTQKRWPRNTNSMRRALSSTFFNRSLSLMA